MQHNTSEPQQPVPAEKPIWRANQRPTSGNGQDGETLPYLNDAVHITQPFLPNREELDPYLDRIWSTKILTNNGPLCQQLEKRLAQELGVNHALLVANATLGLTVALKTQGISGEVITSPFSFVATSQAILMAGLTPVFVDINPDSYGIATDSVRKAITSRTAAILPTHVYGIPCDVDALGQLATEHQLSLIYDAAHCFKSDCHCGSLLGHGDLSVVSLHATKLFNTFEGGVILTNDQAIAQRCKQIRNFGFSAEDYVCDDGLNAKMSELHAAVGLCSINHINEIIADRRRVAMQYLTELKDIDAITLPLGSEMDRSSFGYFPINFRDGEKAREIALSTLRKQKIMARRYFFPLIPEQPPYRHFMGCEAAKMLYPNAWSAARSVLCLPIYPHLRPEVIKKTCNLIRTSL